LTTRVLENPSQIFQKSITLKIHENCPWLAMLGKHHAVTFFKLLYEIEQFLACVGDVQVAFHLASIMYSLMLISIGTLFNRVNGPTKTDPYHSYPIADTIGIDAACLAGM